ncbi:MAG: threonylcarbamoyl-AMP synthase [Lachnospiraceae bacterium]|nr:threonylcarbamoyl-AMP synthase [Lachnospiraceae bacterium]
MNTKIFHIENNENITAKEDEMLREAGEILKNGGLVAFPTETVYGLGGDALNPTSSKKIYAAKGRPSDNPLIVHIYRFEDIYKIVKEVPDICKKLADQFWPGPLTMILEKSDAVPFETTGGLGTVAVRFPSHKTAQKLIEYAGGYVAAPSANVSGRPSPTVFKYVDEDMNGKIEAIIDGGEVGIGLESTIIDLTVDPPQILRPGFITKEKFEEIISKVDVDITTMKGDTGKAPKAPGMKYRHYAPKGDLTIVSGKPESVVSYINEQVAKDKAAGEKVGIICTDELKAGYLGADCVKSAGSRTDEEAIARHLYTMLRQFDDENVTKMYSESFDSSGFGQAIMNRLLKAAGHKVINV